MASRPDRAFRIADSRRQIFDGTGAFLVGARWNSAGRKVIYAADSFAAAMLETLVHTATGKLPSSHRWIEIAIPDAVSFESLDSAALHRWNDEESDSARLFGDEWFDSKRSLILTVPSMVTGGLSRNVLINQDHPEFFQLRASTPLEVFWDSRLFGGTE